MRSKLRVVDGLCLVIATDRPSQYVATTRTIYLRTGVSRTDFLIGLSHELCHAHQHQMIIEAGLTVDNQLQRWYDTAEGRSYLQLSGWKFENSTWVEPQEQWSMGYPGPWEKAAQACAIWYDPAQNWELDYLKKYGGGTAVWAQQWLQK